MRRETAVTNVGVAIHLPPSQRCLSCSLYEAYRTGDSDVEIFTEMVTRLLGISVP